MLLQSESSCFADEAARWPRDRGPRANAYVRYHRLGEASYINPSLGRHVRHWHNLRSQTPTFYSSNLTSYSPGSRIYEVSADTSFPIKSLRVVDLANVVSMRLGQLGGVEYLEEAITYGQALVPYSPGQSVTLTLSKISTLPFP